MNPLLKHTHSVFFFRHVREDYTVYYPLFTVLLLLGPFGHCFFPQFFYASRDRKDQGGAGGFLVGSIMSLVCAKTFGLKIVISKLPIIEPKEILQSILAL